MVHIEDPLVRPYSVGEALARLCQVNGVLARNPEVKARLPQELPRRLVEAGEQLTRSLENEDASVRADSLEEAQTHLYALYAAIAAGDSGDRGLALFGFPPAKGALVAVDVATVSVTHSQPARQVYTTISFDHSPGAIGYRLRETRVIAGEDYIDDCLESPVPAFRRIRFGAGPHRFSIESRDQSGFVVSDEFVVVVPTLT